MYNGECNHSFFDWYLSNFPFKFLFPSFPQSGFSQMDWFIQIKVGLTWMDGTMNSLKNHPKNLHQNREFFVWGIHPEWIPSNIRSPPGSSSSVQVRFPPISCSSKSCIRGNPPPKMVNWGFLRMDGYLFGNGRGVFFPDGFFFVQVDFFCFFQNEKKTLQDIWIWGQKGTRSWVLVGIFVSPSRIAL